MITTKKLSAEMLEAAKPLMKFLSDNYHPHVKIILDYSEVELLECSAKAKTNEFVNG